MSWKLLSLVLCACVAFAVVGCGSGSEFAGQTGEVTGTITLDGVPLADAEVTFNPTADDAGGSSSGTTDSEGKYELYILAEEKGAWLGEHEVLISKETSDEATEETVQVVPPHYNERTELSATVEEGDNVCDFALESRGYKPRPQREQRGPRNTNY